MVAFGVVLYALAAAPAGAAEHVVLESNAADYEAGRTLDAATPISLADGEFLVLATEDGRLLRVVGPHSGPPAGDPPSESSVRRALAQLLGARPAEPAALAGVRAGPAEQDSVPDTRSDPWALHAARSGDQCVLRGEPVRLWRDEVGEGAIAEITDLTSRKSAQVRWTADRREAAWPFEAPPADEWIYLVRSASDLRSVAIRVHALAPEVANKGLATAVWLASRGCVDQARLVLQGPD
jgi:hypothetical protein